LSIGGAGGTGDEEAGEGLKSDEEDVGNRKRRSPVAEIDGNSLENEVNGAAGSLFLCGSGSAAGRARGASGPVARGGGLGRGARPQALPL
jgi:hypothetical protein